MPIKQLKNEFLSIFIQYSLKTLRQSYLLASSQDDRKVFFIVFVCCQGHTDHNLRTFDNLHLGSQIFHFKSHFMVLVFQWKIGKFLSFWGQLVNFSPNSTSQSPIDLPRWLIKSSKTLRGAQLFQISQQVKKINEIMDKRF